VKDVYIESSAVNLPQTRKAGHLVSDASMADMAIAVGKRLLEKYPDHVRKEISHVVVACVGPPGEMYENVATRVQFELNLDKQVSFIQLAGGCYVALSAIEVASTFLNSSDSKYAMVITTDFLSKYVTEKTYKQRPSSTRWGDGAAAMLLTNQPGGKIKVGSFYSMTDGSSWEQYRIKDLGGKLEFDFQDAPENFKSYDMAMAAETIKRCLRKNKLQASDVEGIILLNRSNHFGEHLRSSLGEEGLELHQSFNEIGHLGGTDLLVNIHDLINSQDGPTGRYLVYSCGYGFTWASGLIEIFN
jgi:3-oxoacyl-[acyl-carrier-protein] synthase III